MLIRGLYVLAAIVSVVVLYLVTIWVLGMVGISPPGDLMKAVFVLIGILAVIGALSGRFDNFWT